MNLPSDGLMVSIGIDENDSSDGSNGSDDNGMGSSHVQKYKSDSNDSIFNTHLILYHLSIT